jgi:hypothetical protein
MRKRKISQLWLLNGLAPCVQPLTMKLFFFSFIFVFGGDMTLIYSRRVRTPFFLMLFTAGALGMSSAKASTVDPANYSITGPGTINGSGASPQSGSYSFLAALLM